jgi:hypothetical protein
MAHTPEQLQVGNKLVEVLMPYAAKRRSDVRTRDARFVHYTSAASGLNIINSKSIWMRNTTCMSDYSEVRHGFGTLNRHPNTKALLQALDHAVNGVGREALTLFNQWWNDTQFGTYVTSISEHNDGEDQHGRLSMWRAFARASARIAIVLKIPMDEQSAQSLNLLFSPVAYFTEAELGSELSSVIQNVQENQEFLRSTARPVVVSAIFHMLLLAVVCLKHEGFFEEEEWRVIYAPKRNPSPLMSSAIEVIDGVPQTIYKIPLSGGPPDDLVNLSVPRLIDRIIIGASAYPWVMYEAFVAALANAGVTDAAARVFVSGIPIRT